MFPRGGQNVCIGGSRQTSESELGGTVLMTSSAISTLPTRACASCIPRIHLRRLCSCLRVRGTILGKRGRKEDKGLIDTKYDTRRARVWAKLGFTKFWSNCGSRVALSASVPYRTYIDPAASIRYVRGVECLTNLPT
jgi:hypothetical protein